MLRIVLFVLSLIAHLPVMATSINQTKDKLNAINGKINLLRHTLASANDRRGALNKELAHIEKQISEGINQLRLMQQQMNQKQQEIAVLHQNMDTLNKQLSIQQQLLIKQIRLRYKMGEYQSLKWLLNQEDPERTNRMLTYSQYIIKAQQTTIDTINTTEKALNNKKHQLDYELQDTQQLQARVNNSQQQLKRDKDYHSALLQSLNNEIDSKQHTLDDYKKDKNNLSRLLQLLVQQHNTTQSTLSFATMRKKLPSPLLSKPLTIEKMNQGVTFFADEGTPVTAVYSGKVVFSDWLKGYGLLLIIDHGQGYMTLYAHNQALFKHKGDTVSSNEQIASVGHSGGLQQNGLYFEIRRQGKAIPPLEWLEPKKILAS